MSVNKYNSTSGELERIDSIVSVDATPTSGSTNPAQSGGVYTALQNISGQTVQQSSVTVATGSWASESYTSTSGIVYAYKYAVAITGITSSSWVDISMQSGSYTGNYCLETNSASGYAVIRTATQPSASISFNIYYKL